MICYVNRDGRTILREDRHARASLVGHFFFTRGKRKGKPRATKYNSIGILGVGGDIRGREGLEVESHGASGGKTSQTARLGRGVR